MVPLCNRPGQAEDLGPEDLSLRYRFERCGHLGCRPECDQVEGCLNIDLSMTRQTQAWKDVGWKDVSPDAGWSVMDLLGCWFWFLRGWFVALVFSKFFLSYEDVNESHGSEDKRALVDA